MRKLYVFTLFDGDQGKPRCTGVKVGDTVNIYDLHRPGGGKEIGTIKDRKAIIRGLFLKANTKDVNIVTSDFKNHLAAFDLPLDIRTYNVYDLHLPDVKPTASFAKDSEIIKQVLEKMATNQVKEYQKIIANAAVVYHDLQLRGLSRNYHIEHPVWSQKTFSGRSKTSGFNIQGFTNEEIVTAPGASDRQVLIHFDWISADIRAAAYLSGDQKLNDTFFESDPYTHMMDEINSQSTTKIDRDECKTFLLKSINSMDIDSIALTTIYPVLGAWIARCKRATLNGNGYLETMLKRRFRVCHAKNPLAVLNGAMQGSVAHGMQIAVRKIWERLGHRLITEIHDSLVVTSSPEPNEVRATIAAVAPIMLYPFNGILSDNPAFPVKVSMGKKWRRWRLVAIYRESGVEYAKTDRTPKTTEKAEVSSESQAEES